MDLSGSILFWNFQKRNMENSYKQLYYSEKVTKTDIALISMCLTLEHRKPSYIQATRISHLKIWKSQHDFRWEASFPSP